MSHVDTTLSANFAENKSRMTINSEIPSALIEHFLKIWHAGYGSALMTIPFAIGIPDVLKSIFQNTEHREFYVIAFVFLICFLLFTFVFIIDFITGINASKKEALLSKKDNYISSGRLWSSFWKLAVFFVISFPLFSFISIFYLLEMNFIYYLLLSIAVIFMMLATFVEIFSIGENLKRIYGKKPDYFVYFDMMSKALERLFTKKLNNLKDK